MIPGVQELEQYRCTLYETRDQLKRHIYDRADEAFRAGDDARDRIVNQEQLAQRQQGMKHALLEAVGGLPASDTPLQAQVTGIARGDGYRVEKIIFESKPRHYVTSNLYVPADAAEPSPAVLFLCGHELEGKHSPYYHEVCLRFVQAGLIVLAIDPIGQGERLAMLSGSDGSQLWGTAEHERLGVLSYSVGQSVARYFIHDAMRAIDYLETRPEVDPRRIGVTGNSGGGTQTAMMMVCDERIAAAAPATFIMNRQQYMHAGGVQDAEQIWPGLTGLGYDHEDLLLAFAPKPLLVCAVTYDFFPIEATRRTVSRTRRFWEMHGRAEQHRLVEDRSTHRYTDKLAIAAADFFAQYLAGQSESVRADYRERAARTRLTPLAPEQLHCTTSGQVRQEFADAESLVDMFKRQADQLAAVREARMGADSLGAKEQAAQRLARQVFHERQRCALNPRIVDMPDCDGLSVQYAMWWSQQGVLNSGYLFQSAAPDTTRPAAVTIALWPGGTTDLATHWSWIQSACAAGRTVLVLNASGVGPHEPHSLHGKPQHSFFGMLHKLSDELIWLGDSLAALRTYDVIRSVDFIYDWFGAEGHTPQLDIEVRGTRLYRLYTELASIVDSRIARSDDQIDDTIDDTQTTRVRLSAWLAQGLADDRDVMSVIWPGLLHDYDIYVAE